MDNLLAGKVAVVTGASRGIGKGIALELGAAGATVYLTGRSETPGPVPGTIGATVTEIDAIGGRGIAIRCDHHDDTQVRAVFDRVRAEQGRLDVLVNNVFSAPDLAPWLDKPFWELPTDAWDEIVGVGTRSHYVASVFGVPLMTSGGLIVNVSSKGSTRYSRNVLFGIGKAALDKMTADMAVDLRPRGIAVLSIWPGIVHTELLTLGARRDVAGNRWVLDIPGDGLFDLSAAESPRFVGRGVVGLATDRDLLMRSGCAETTAELAARYDFTDVDGRRPEVRTPIG